jgi:hypothetical protein
MKVAEVEGQDSLSGPNESVWPFVALLAGCAVAGAAFGFVVLALFQASALVAVVLGVMTALALVLFTVFKAEYPLGEAYAVAGSMFAGLCLVSAFAYLRFELPATERANWLRRCTSNWRRMEMRRWPRNFTSGRPSLSRTGLLCSGRVPIRRFPGSSLSSAPYGCGPELQGGSISSSRLFWMIAVQSRTMEAHTFSS